MNGDFFNYQNKQEYPVWHAWGGDEILLSLLTLWVTVIVILMIVIFIFCNFNGGLRTYSFVGL